MFNMFYHDNILKFDGKMRITSNIFSYIFGGRLYQLNEDDFRFKFSFISLLNSMDTQKHKSFSLITCKLGIRKKLVNN